MGCDCLFDAGLIVNWNSHHTGSAVPPIREPAADQNPESTVRAANPGSRLASLENDELLAQTQILSHQSRLGFDGGGEAAGKETDQAG